MNTAMEYVQRSAMKEVHDYVARVAEHFKNQLAPSVVEVYKLGSLAHGGFSEIYSDIDVGVILSCSDPPSEMDRLIAGAKGLDGGYGKKLSVFWGNPDCSWGRLPVLDRLDVLDHGVPLLAAMKATFSRPSKEAIHLALRDSLNKSWMPKLDELSRLTALAANYRKPYVRSILYPARLIYSWDNLAVDSNDRAVEYLEDVKPAGLDLRPIKIALACRRGECAVDDLFALRSDLKRQFKSAISYISARR